MNTSSQIDKRISELSGWRGEMYSKLSQIIREASPNLTEEWKWDTAVWSSSGLVCAVGAFKDNVGINFFKGASLPDPDHLFNAGLEAKASRSVRFYEGDKINESALKDLIRSAVTQNTR